MISFLTTTHLITWALATSLMACVMNYGRQYGFNFKPERKLG